MRQWAPGAQEMWLMGDFNNWKKFDNPFCRLEFGKWEIKLGPNGQGKVWYFKIVLTYFEKKIVLVIAFSLEFAKFLRSLEQIIQTVKGQNNFW